MKWVHWILTAFLILPHHLMDKDERSEPQNKDTLKISKVKDPFVDKDGDGINDLLKKRKKKQKVVEDVLDVLNKFLEKQSHKKSRRK